MPPEKNMRVTAEISLYPLHDEYLGKIESVIRQIRSCRGLEIVVNQMSTQIRGELSDVVAALESAVAASFGDERPAVLVTKILNADLPIAEVPAV
jgi:uncharacterized protein YqgV (UPF0045/DUF77 family)